MLSDFMKKTIHLKEMKSRRDGVFFEGNLKNDTSATEGTKDNPDVMIRIGAFPEEPLYNVSVRGHLDQEYEINLPSGSTLK